MRNTFTKTFDELLTSHYGDLQQIEASNTAKVEELFANYYGKSPRRKRKTKSTPASEAVSLSFDNGEILQQLPAAKSSNDQVALNPPSPSGFQEYVVTESLLPGASSPNANAPSSPQEEVSAFQEYLVDVLEPLKEATGSPTAATVSSPAEPPAPCAGDKPKSMAVAAQALPLTEATSRAKPTDDDFVADMQKILTGQAVFDPVTKKTIEKDKLGRPQTGSSQSDEGPPMPEAKKTQAIFDKIAQSMQYANRYDLGTVELENRFADFDKISDLQQKAALEKKSKQSGAPDDKPSSGATVDTSDFIQDLDNIRKPRPTVKAGPEPATSSASHTPEQFAAQSSAFANKWDRIASEVFGYASYDDYLAQELKSYTFFGQNLQNLNSELIQRLDTVQADLTNTQGAGYNAPPVNSTLRKRAGMHGWGMAIDFDALNNPYVLNEHGEGQLDQELVRAYDHIADFMLGKSQTDLRKLKNGRSAFGGGTIGEVYDALRAESDAMKRYFSLMNDDAGLQSFLQTEWPAKHTGQAPDLATIKAQMKDDYEVLGGKTDTGDKRPTGGKGDRPFAPSSAGGRGDPATGFLNFGKEFVVAMTNAGFAWGAIDIAGEPGDIMHFDIRLQGTGARVYNLLLKYK